MPAAGQNKVVKPCSRPSGAHEACLCRLCNISSIQTNFTWTSLWRKTTAANFA